MTHRLAENAEWKRGKMEEERMKTFLSDLGMDIIEPTKTEDYEEDIDFWVMVKGCKTSVSFKSQARAATPGKGGKRNIVTEDLAYRKDGTVEERWFTKSKADIYVIHITDDEVIVCTSDELRHAHDTYGTETNVSHALIAKEHPHLSRVVVTCIPVDTLPRVPYHQVPAAIWFLIMKPIISNMLGLKGDL